MPQFSLKRLLVSMTLIAMGCWLAVWAINRPTPGERWLWILSTPLFGLAIGNLYKRPALGFLMGLFVVLGLMALLAVYSATHHNK